MKNRKLNYLKVTGFCWALAIICIILLYISLAVFCSGCAPQKSFHKIIHLKNIEIHIVSDRSQFDNEHARMCRGVNGYAKRNGEVWVLGWQTKDGIRVNFRTMGHEIGHIINWQDSDFANPDMVK